MRQPPSGGCVLKRANDSYLSVATYLNPVTPELRNVAEDKTLLLTSYPKEVKSAQYRLTAGVQT